MEYEIDRHTGAALIPLGGKKYQGLYAKVDPCDIDLVSEFSWRAVETNPNAPHLLYASAYVRGTGHKGRYAYMHRLILGVSNPKQHTDHINRNGLDNRRANLRIVTPQENQFNRTAQRGSSSRFKGVSWRKTDQQWSAQIWHNGKAHNLGLFHDEIEAAIAYDHAVRELFGPIGYLNFPGEQP